MEYINTSKRESQAFSLSCITCLVSLALYSFLPMYQQEYYIIPEVAAASFT
jgi:hypothetical protein